MKVWGGAFSWEEGAGRCWEVLLSLGGAYREMRLGGALGRFSTENFLNTYGWSTPFNLSSYEGLAASFIVLNFLTLREERRKKKKKKKNKFQNTRQLELGLLISALCCGCPASSWHCPVLRVGLAVVFPWTQKCF